MRVLISGAGVAGPTLAYFLAQAGVHVTVFEKARSLLCQGQNIDLQGSALSIVKKMGLFEEIRRLNTGEKGSQLIDSKGKAFAQLPVRERVGASLTSEFEILRGDLAAVLYSATESHPNVKYRFDTTVKRIISNDEHSIEVETSQGQVEEYDVVVAADGQWSALRREVFPSPDAVTVVDKNLFVAYYTVPRLPSDNDWWNIYLTSGSRSIKLRPDSHGTMRAMLSCVPYREDQKQEWNAAVRSDRQTQEDLVRKEFADAGWLAPRLLDAMPHASDFYFQAVKQIKMASWHNGRVVCLGDTAYAPTPLTGMGTSLAITGAYVLAGELSKFQEGQHPNVAFKAYEDNFRPYVEQSQEIPSFLPGVAYPRTIWGRLFIHTVMSTISWIAAIPGLVERLPSRDEDDFSLPHYEKIASKEE